MSLRPLKQDMSVFNNIGLELEPVGIKYEFFKPEGIDKLDKVLALCEMVKEAQQNSKSFFITRDNEDCAGKCAMGMMEGPEWGDSGEIGEKMEIFQDSRANRHCMTHYKTFKPGTINYAIFSPLSKLTFEPDLIVFVTIPENAEKILRAMSYSTGEMYESKGTPIFQCSWLYTYPVVTQKINYILTDMSFGMRAREVYPPGNVIVSVPWTWIPVIIENLKEMKLVLPAWRLGRDKWLQEEAKILQSVDEKAKTVTPESREFTTFGSE
ncbi:MAG: DUF169 domain-containing protein [Spirochaetes bacterium]|nr:DUF169 domain-containing protein [Spirochaetota bacterium]